MLSYFRVNDPYRLIGILLLLIIIRIPFWLINQDMLISELNWMIVGEKLNQGDMIYANIWDNISPLSSITYQVIDYLFGRSLIAYRIISFIIVFIQATIFTQILIKCKAYNQNTYIPGLIYIILMSSFFDFYTASPILLSVIFILLTIKNILFNTDNKLQDENALYTGFYLGIACLFYLPNILFVLAVLTCYLMVSGTRIRRYILFLYGLLMVFAFAVLYFYWNNGLKEFGFFYILSAFDYNKNYTDLTTILFVVFIPTVFLILSFVKLFFNHKFIQYQISYQQIMLVIFFFSLPVWAYGKYEGPHQLIIFVPTVAFFLTHFFIGIQNRRTSELSFIVFFLGIMTVNYGKVIAPQFFSNYLKTDDLYVKNTDWDFIVEGKKVLLFDDNISVYKKSKMSTPFLNWHLTKSYLENYSEYHNLTTIHRHIEKDHPEVIIDPNHVLEKIMVRMPLIQNRYTKTEGKPIYLLSH